MGYSRQRKKPGWRRSSKCVQNAFFRLSSSERNAETPLESILPISILYHHFGWAFASSAKSWVDEGRPIAFKTRFFDFAHYGETKNHPWNRIYQFRFHTTIFGGLSQASKKAGLTKVVRLRSKLVNSTFPIGGIEKTPLDRIQRVRYHTTILGGLYQGAENAGLTKNVQLRWKLVFSSFPIWAKRKKTLWIEFHEVGLTPPFWVGFSQQRKKPGWRRSSNCVQNSFFGLFP